MNYNTKKFFSAFAILMLLFSLMFIQSCKPDDEIKEYNGVQFTSDGTLSLNFVHAFGLKHFKYSPDSFFTTARDTVKFTQLTYYISNITLEKEDGGKTNLNTYHLINEDVPTSKLVTVNVPKGKYKSISFLLGVDNTRNHSGVQEGALDPAYGMFWTWNTGYVFFRLKGYFGENYKPIAYDIGGDDHTVKYGFNLTGVKVNKTDVHMELTMNVAEFFTAPNIINLQIDKSSVHTSTDTDVLPRLHENMKDMFSLTGIY